MRHCYIRILFLILPIVFVTARTIHKETKTSDKTIPSDENIESIHKLQDSLNKDQVISVRITSSVAVGRGRDKQYAVSNNNNESDNFNSPAKNEMLRTTTEISFQSSSITTEARDLSGANVEFIKQLLAKKEAQKADVERGHPYRITLKNFNASDDSIAESSIKSVHGISFNEHNDYDDDVPRARSIPSGLKNYIQEQAHDTTNKNNDQKLTTVSFSIVHDPPKVTSNYEHNSLPTPHQSFPRPHQLYSDPVKSYSEPAKFYSEPAKVYSEPAKVYSEPAKVYGEPAKVYSEPAKVYSEPAKFYSEPASLHLPVASHSNPTSWKQNKSTTVSTTPVTTVANTNVYLNQPEPEKNYEVDEKVSVLTDGRSHGVQESGTENCKQDNCKVGYVVEGRQYRKYRVEERTPEGFIVGEYGVLRHEDGVLRGVRYTADSDASPRLIHDALMKFLQLK